MWACDAGRHTWRLARTRVARVLLRLAHTLATWRWGSRTHRCGRRCRRFADDQLRQQPAAHVKRNTPTTPTECALQCAAPPPSTSAVSGPQRAACSCTASTRLSIELTSATQRGERGIGMWPQPVPSRVVNLSSGAAATRASVMGSGGRAASAARCAACPPRTCCSASCSRVRLESAPSVVSRVGAGRRVCHDAVGCSLSA